ncbi:MAG: hypothetical protein R3C18_21940 [Planctomycetaceae bacterium]
MGAPRTTWNYILSFKGWAQCRMATDPDPSNEKRGVSGYTFALPGERDLDQIIYFQPGDGVVPRSFCPEVGIRVVGGSQYKATTFANGSTTPREEFQGEPTPIAEDNPFYEARVDLVNSPLFDSRNSTIVYDGYGLISPFDMQIRTVSSPQELTIERSYCVDPSKPGTSLSDVPILELQTHVMKTQVYNSENLNSPYPGSANILLESNILDPSAYRFRRRQQLEGQLAETECPTERAALKKRIAELRIADPKNRRSAQMGAKVLAPYNLNSLQATLNNKEFDPGPAWPLEMWMGGWDADSLCFFTMGTLKMSFDFDPFNLCES